jgi:hypothetical protein
LTWHLDRENPERVGSDELEEEVFDSEDRERRAGKKDKPTA